MKTNYVLESEDEFERLEEQINIPGYSLDEEFGDLRISGNGLDAGCGTGLVSRYLMNKNNCSITAIDFSDLRVEQAKKHPKNKSDLSFEVGNLYDLKFDENQFDFVISRYVIEHLTNPSLVFAELHRVTREEGLVRIVDLDGIFFNLYSVNDNLNYLLNKFKKGLPTDFYIGRKLPALMTKAGFKNIKWRASSEFFQGESLELEKANMRTRLNIASSLINEILGAEDGELFKKLYLKALDEKETVLFFNKFIVDATK